MTSARPLELLTATRQPLRGALVMGMWRYGDGRTARENGRIIRNAQATYNVLVRVDALRWRVLAGSWSLRPMAFRALCVAWRRHWGEFFTANNYEWTHENRRDG